MYTDLNATNMSKQILWKKALNCGTGEDKIENILCRIHQSNIVYHTNTVVIIYGANNLDGDKPSAS